MIDSAFTYLAEGFSVIPLRENKAPAIISNPFIKIPMKEDEIIHNFSKAKKLGIACGVVSGGLECLDFDAHKGEPIRKILSKFLKDDGISTIIELHDLPIIQTPSGGFHLLYKCDEIEGSRKIALWENGDVMIETRGEGAYIATIPSPGYKLVKGSEIIKTAVISSDERDYIISFCEELSEKIQEKTDERKKGNWPQKYDVTTVWGKYNEEENEEAKELLLNAGWEFIRTRKTDNTELWMRPGKDTGKRGKHVSATFGKLHNMFYVFSTNAEPFKAQRAYSLFDIFLLLKHKNNKVEAIKELEKRYGIQHYKPSVKKTTVDFPIKVFPEKIINYINEQNEESNFDINLMASTFIWLTGTMIGNRFTTFVNNTWKNSPVIWLMIIAERGSTKTHAINAIIHPAKKFDKESRHIFEKELELYNPDSGEKKPEWKQLFIEDGTREGFIRAMNANKTGLGLMKDELTGWLHDMNRHSSGKGGDEAFWLASFNNTDNRKNIKGDEGTYIDRVFISLAGSVQPVVLNEIIKDHSENGLLDRFLLVPFKEKEFVFKMKKPTISYFKWYSDFIKLFHDMMNRYDSEGIDFEFLPDAEVEFEKAYNKFLSIKYKEDSPAMRAYIAKIITYLPRITLIIELLVQIYDITEGYSQKEYINPYIKKDSVIKAFDILMYFTNNARNVFIDVSQNSELDNIIRASGAIKTADKITVLVKAMLTKEVDTNQVTIANHLSVRKSLVNYYYKKYKDKTAK